jgi:hypothetical protein
MTKSEKYDELYEKVQNLIKKENPCRIDKDGICIRERTRKELFGVYKKNNCCGSPYFLDLSDKGTCKFLGENGCTIKSLQCSIWFCDFIYLMYKGTDFIKEVEKLRKEIAKNDFNDHRKPRDFTLKKIEIKEKIENLNNELVELYNKD